jgi:kinesin family protein 3/17
MSKAKALGGSKSECIKVAIRCRPMSKREIQDNREAVVRMIHSKGEVVIQKQSEEVPKIFTFDCVYDHSAS